MQNIFPFRQRVTHIPLSSTFTITEIGKSKVEEYTGDLRSRILMALENNGASNIDEIAKSAQLQRGTVIKAIPKLIKGGYIQPIRSGMD